MARFGLLDRAIAVFAPEAALRRAQARAALAATRAYEAAGHGRRLRNWPVSSSGPKDEIGPPLARLRARARDLVRNNPYASRAMDIVVAHQVGYGITPRSRTGAAALDERVMRLWREWVKVADVTGQHDFYGMQALAARTRAEAGEVIIRLYRDAPAGGVPLRLHVLEPDHLDEQKNEIFADSGVRIVNGVEIDSRDRPIAYWIFPDHPGDWASPTQLTRVSERVPASDVIHLFRRTRPGQVRGVPDLAPVVTRLRGLDDYQEAELERARVQACFSVFVTSPAAATSPLIGQVTDIGERRRTVSPGMIDALLPGEDVKFGSPAAGDAYGDHVRTVLRAIAIGTGLTYHQLTGDLSDANYSSLRAGNIEFRRLTEQAQWLMLIPGLCERVWGEWVRMAQLAGLLRSRAAGYAVDWTPPAFEAVDPLKDAEAEEKRIALMLTSPQRAIAAQGYDPDEILAEHAEWAAKRLAAGLAAPPAEAPPAAETTEPDTDAE